MKVYLKMSGKLRSLTAYTTLTLVVLSAISSLLIALPLVEVVRAQTPSITVSSEYFNPHKAILVEVRGDLGTYIRVRITDDITGDPLAEEDVYRIAPGYYAFYLLGPDATVANPISGAPLIPVDPGDKGTPVRIDVVGTALTYVVRYDVVKPTVTLDRKEYPYRRDATVVISYTDEDADRDPTARDILLPEHVAVAITLIKAGGTVRTATTDLRALGASSSTESAVRGGRFTFAVTISRISSALGVPIGKDDRVLLSLCTKADAQGWDDDPTTVDFRAVYRYPTVSVTFNQQVLVIDVTSHDDNVDSRVADTLEPGAHVILTVGTATYPIPAADFRETGANTNVFRMTFSATWGTAYSIDYAARRVTLPRDTVGPFEATARYYKEAADPGYSIDASGRGTYAPVLPTIRVDKASLRSIIVTITKPDLNNDPRDIERLVGKTLLTTGKFDVRLDKGDVYLARIRILDREGRLVDFTGSPADVTMVETDFNSGVFVLVISGGLLGIRAGETYTLEYRDFAGFRGDAIAAHRVSVTFRAEEIRLTIDRTEYPAVPGTSVAVYVDYANDLYNRDETRRERVTISYSVISFDGTATLASGTITLEETDVNTGLFRTKATVPIPADTRAVGGKLVIFDPARPEARVEATLKVYDGELTASPATIRMGGVITITVRDPDFNRDSGVAEEWTTLVSVRSGRCPTFSVTLRETGANTGVFTATVRWDRTTGAISGCAAAPDSITIEYVDTRARELITGYEPYTVTLRATVTLASTTGVLRTATAEANKVSIIEAFRIVVEDWDLNVRFNARDRATVYVLVEGVHAIAPVAIDLDETGANTGVFEMSLRLTDISGVPPDIRELARLIGRRVVIMYVDEADAAGARTLTQTTLTITAYDPELRLSPEAAVRLGEVLTVTVVDKNRVGAGTVSIMVRSTIYPVPITYYAREELVGDRPTGVFTARIRVVDIKDWYPGYPEPSVPARFGDTVEVIYIAPVNSKGETDVIYTKSITAGIRPAIPAETKKVEFLDERGAAVTPRVGVLTFITVTVANADIVTHSMAIMVVVRDPTGVAVALYFASVTLPPGASQHVGFGWTPMVSGKHTIEVYVVKSLADRTPMASPTSATVDVAK